MLFGFINALASMQTLINNILYEFLKKFVIIYLNDIIIYFKTKKNMFNILIRYLKYLKIGI